MQNNNPPPLHKEQGAVLPIVLLMLAVLSILASITYQSVSSATGYMIDLRDRQNLEIALINAEQEAIFVFLTGQGTQKGVYTGPPIDPTQLTLGDIDLDTFPDESFWLGIGEYRRSVSLPPQTGRPAPDISVQYIDGDGLFSFTQVSEEAIVKYFEQLDLTSRQIEAMVPKLLDYQDEDTVRRFQGAERAEYRLLGRQPPANSPIRTPGELLNIVGFEDFMTPERWHQLLLTTAYGKHLPFLRSRFAVNGLEDVVGIFTEENATLAAGERFSPPSSKARFILTVPSRGDIITRIVDIDNTAGAIDKPFQRYHVGDFQFANTSRTLTNTRSLSSGPQTSNQPTQTGTGIAYFGGETTDDIPILFRPEAIAPTDTGQ